MPGRGGLALILFLLLHHDVWPHRGIGVFCTKSDAPLVIIPPELRWGSLTNIYVTPSLQQDRAHVDISLMVEEDGDHGLKTEVFSQTLQNRPSRSTTVFNVQLPAGSHSVHYYVRVEIDGHSPATAEVPGAPNVRSIYVQTDKVFYRPAETVLIRALPITHEDSLYGSPVEFELHDPNGFKIFNHSAQVEQDRFIATYFQLPQYLRYGTWKVVAQAGKHSQRFIREIRVKEFDLPKYQVMLSLKEASDSPTFVKALVHARFHHGMLVSGNLILRCAVYANRHENDKQQPATTQTTHKLLEVELVGGYWNGTLNVAPCVASVEKPPPRIHVVAEVHENNTFLAGTAISNIDTFVAGFELVPLRPGFTKECRTLRIYVRHLNRQIHAASTLLVTAQCISADRRVNGLNQSVAGQKIGTIVEFDVDSRCSVYIIRASRRLAAGTKSREAEMLVIPLLDTTTRSMNFTWIQPLQPQKAIYREGEVLEIALPATQRLGFMLRCNERDIAAAGSVPSNGLLNISVTSRMVGACTLYAFAGGVGSFQVDMHLFFFLSNALCPADDYGLRTSVDSIQVFREMQVELRARPNSLATLSVYDTKLESLLSEGLVEQAHSRSSAHWDFHILPFKNTVQEFLKAEGYHPPQIHIINMMNVGEFIRNTKSLCREVGRHVSLPCPKKSSTSSTTASVLSDECLLQLSAECESGKGGQNSNGNNNDSLTDGNESKVQIAGVPSWNGFPFLRRPQAQGSAATMHAPPTVFNMKTKTGGEGIGEAGEDDVLTVRDYFPEVWLFGDYKIGESGQRLVKLRSPHSVTEWRMLGHFWTPGRSEVCMSREQPVVKTARQVFMDVELPTSVYENETINVRVLVMSGNQDVSEEKMSICFRGLSPLVCGDTGHNGSLGDPDWNRVVLRKEAPIQIKQFYVSFLRDGFHNLTFELRGENHSPGGGWHCREEGVAVFDRITKIVHVKKRVTTEEHFRQIVVYPQRRIAPGGRKRATRLPGVTQHSTPDVISYSQTTDTERGLIFTEIKVDSNERVLNMDVELSEFTPSLPPATLQLAHLLPPYSPLRNRVGGRFGLRAKKRQTSQRHTRGVGLVGLLRNREGGDSSTVSYSIVSVLKELSTVTYELKTLRSANAEGNDASAEMSGPSASSRNFNSNEIREREAGMGHLLSELLTFSDCTSVRAFDSNRISFADCGYGEFGKPRTPKERNILLTTLATSLLCEQGAAEEYVCSPLRFLAAIASKLNISDSTDEWNLGFSTHLSIDKRRDQVFFLQSFIARMSQDCSAYSCVWWFKNQDARETWKQLHAKFYNFREDDNFDLRTEAALAYTSTPNIAKMMRHRLGTRANIGQTPLWSILSHSALDESPLRNYLDMSLLRSGNLLANALALLAYCADEKFYRFWKEELDLDALANWLIEEQSMGRQFDGAIDTYFGARALYHYQLRQKWGKLERSPQIVGNLTSPITDAQYHFTGEDLPFALGVPSSTSLLTLTTKGEGRLLMGVRLVAEKRRRSRRGDSANPFPVSISLNQSRSQQNGDLIVQSITLTTHSTLLRTLEIEHGLFTGFTALPQHVELLGGGEFLVRPMVTSSAVHFVIDGIAKDHPLFYKITMSEPMAGYSSTDLAPVSILAKHHSVVGRYLMDPTALSFTAAPDAADSEAVVREKRSGRNYGRPALGLTTRSRRISLAELEHASPSLATTESSFVQNQSSWGTVAGTVDKVCLENGACTCAESTCDADCTDCSQMDMASICAQIYQPNRFGLIFRHHPHLTSESMTTVVLDGAEYTVVDVEMRDLLSSDLNGTSIPVDIEDRRPLSLWIRTHCNSRCVKMARPKPNGQGADKRRFLLIGDPAGLFDGTGQEEWYGGASSPSPPESEFEIEDEMRSEPGKRTSRRRRRSKGIRMHYVMKDTDRLFLSADCQTTFGEIQDGHCYQ